MDLKLGNVLDALMALLDCPQKKIALLVGLDQHTLSNNRETQVKNLTPRTRQRLGALSEVIRHIGPLRSEIMLAALERHTYKDHKGRMDSVVSAIHQDKYDLPVLLVIAEKAKKELTEEWSLSYPSVTETDLRVST